MNGIVGGWEAEDRHHRFTWAFHALVDGLVGRLDPEDVREVREYVEYDECALGVDDLLGLLVLLRVPMTPTERDEVEHITSFFPNPRSGFTSYLRNKSDVIAALHVTGEPDRPRGVGVLRGGHRAGAGRRGTTEFPLDWDADRIAAAGRSVTAHRDASRVVLANGRQLISTLYDGVVVGVVSDEDGVRSVFPTEGAGVHRNADAPADRDSPTFRDLIVGRISNLIARIPAEVAECLSEKERRAYRDLHISGEWAEAADVLAARLIRPDVVLPFEVRRWLHILLMCFDLPVDGCAFINRRGELLGGAGRR